MKKTAAPVPLFRSMPSFRLDYRVTGRLLMCNLPTNFAVQKTDPCHYALRL